MVVRLDEIKLGGFVAKYTMRVKVVCNIILVFLISMYTFVVSGCDKKPDSNTAEYLSLHGIVEGEDNYIQVGDILLKIPSTIKVNVITYGKIKKGKADIVKLYLDFSDVVGRLGDVGIFSPHIVRVEIRNFQGISRDESLALLNETEWEAVSFREELGLFEYRSKRFTGGWGYITYVSPESSDGVLWQPVILKCTGHPVGDVDMCRGSYQKNLSLSVWYYLDGEVLPYWYEIISGIDNELNSLIKG